MQSLVDTNNNISIIRKTNGKLPRLPFVLIKNLILGKKYELSVVFVNRKTAIRLHQEWKKLDDPVNILSFPLDDTTGEIIISLEKTRSEAKKFERTYQEHLQWIIIHGCAHLKGYTHGNTMDQFEKKIYKKIFATN